ncbi:hypothetical protein C5610_00670 [Idiomarina sp. OT37-5b]|jgi:uncharacterized Tic20 family protein|uniref:DUF4870 domain-containing protein n=1 Tax=Idiomarina aquatica TaxID=1327752 RepID=A0AA94JE62_9GAMM|nr:MULTISPECIES: DUF4870 domain-containing protein [Idiomarina]AVJ54939.1 hypothetical protein C5610_00670 [Idiomarina sp. OT37-5b]RUO45529.1 hypothetical protein CWE23_05915 [Idiomarina aquatica]
MDDTISRITDEQTNYAMLMHLSQFATFIIPFIGWLAPIVMWFLKRDNDFIDRHGKFIFNWMLSLGLYGIGILLSFLVMPILSLVAVLLFALFSIVMIVLAAVQAKQGMLKPYLLSIPFFK